MAKVAKESMRVIRENAKNSESEDVWDAEQPGYLLLNSAPF